MIKSRQISKGFTLLELLIVIIIIVLLAAIILANLSTAGARGRDARRLADLKQFQQALENYFENYGIYPSNPYIDDPTKPFSVYLTSPPKDPLTANNYAYSSPDGTTYCVGTTLEIMPPPNGVPPSSSCTAPLTNYKIGGP